MKWCVVLILIFQCCSLQAQDDFTELHSASLEELAEAEEQAIDDEHNSQELLEYKRHNLSINASRDELAAFPLFEPHHVENIILYRKLFGDFISVYELQAVPGFTSQFCHQIAPYIAIGNDELPLRQLKQIFSGGTSSLVVRPVLVKQAAKGFASDDSLSRFTGDRIGMLVRYKYKYRKQLQYGVTLEKDPGEAAVSRSFPFLGDFQSMHFVWRGNGKLKLVSVGDYTINMGQGLIHWQSQAYRKSASVLNIKRQGDMVKPYQSVGEFNFFRGAAIVSQLGQIEVAAFVSRSQLTANIATGEDGRRIITSVNTSGLHRSVSELADKHSAALTSSGGRMKWNSSHLNISWNFIYHHYSVPLQKRQLPYNVFSIKGRNWTNSSIDFSSTIRNYHVFAEIALDHLKNPAGLGGVVSSVHRNLDFAILFRHLSRRYQSVFGNAFTEATSPGNEQGMYTAFSFRPAGVLRIDAYTDVFRFQWLKYRVDAPSNGYHYFVQLTWKPAKTVECYTRFRNRVKSLNIENDVSEYVENTTLWNWRTHLSVQVTKTVGIRSRMEMCRFRASPDGDSENGYLYYSDVTIKPAYRPYSFNIRLQYFEADGFNSRLYAHEKDLLMASSIPSFQDRGLRYYVNINVKQKLRILGRRQLTASLKVANLTYFNKEEVGSGSSAILGQSRTDVRFQAFIS